MAQSVEATTDLSLVTSFLPWTKDFAYVGGLHALG